MFFQFFNNKSGCINFYRDSQFLKDIDDKCKITWRHGLPLAGKNIDFAQIYVSGQELDDVCPEHLKKEWGKLQTKLYNFFISFEIGKINIHDVCFFDLLPEKFLKNYCETKNKICQWVIDNNKKPEHYDMMKNILDFITEIETRELNLNWSKLNTSNIKSRALLKRKNAIPSKVQYDPWKTITGRLATTPNSFPILTINKESRSIIRPQNDLFLELDYNSAELRTAFGLLKLDQPTIDIHDWISEKVFEGKFTREKSKEKTFAWLYNAKASNKKLEKIFDKQKILDYHYDGNCVNTIYNRNIEVDEKKALNYIIQSTTSDLVLTQAMKINKLIEKSFIAFVVHDSIVIDVDRSDQGKLNEIIDVFSKTDLGIFKTNVSLGKSFGSMRRA